MSFMTTSRGNKFFPLEPARTVFDIKDVAHALSNLCRFGGHVKKFYSVAQHSILVADIVKAQGGDADAELWALMHDSTEAYMVDMPTPIKAVIKGYSDMEHRLMSYLINGFALPNHKDMGQLPDVVKFADAVALVTEARQLMHGGLKDWDLKFKTLKPHATTIYPVSPARAEKAFLARYRKIQAARRRQASKIKIAA